MRAAGSLVLRGRLNKNGSKGCFGWVLNKNRPGDALGNGPPLRVLPVSLLLLRERLNKNGSKGCYGRVLNKNQSGNGSGNGLPVCPVCLLLALSKNGWGNGEGSV